MGSLDMMIRTDRDRSKGSHWTGPRA